MGVDMKTVRLLISITKTSDKDSLYALKQTNNNMDEAIKLLKEQGKIPPEEADRILAEREQQSSVVIRCPKCGYDDFEVVKRGWKLTTGFIGSGKNQRVCKKCLYKW